MSSHDQHGIWAASSALWRQHCEFNVHYLEGPSDDDSAVALRILLHWLHIAVVHVPRIGHPPCKRTRIVFVKCFWLFPYLAHVLARNIDWKSMASSGLSQCWMRGHCQVYHLDSNPSERQHCGLRRPFFTARVASHSDSMFEMS